MPPPPTDPSPHTPSPRSGPLSGVRVLDLTTVVSGPMCTQALGDLGADVIKLEAPAGDQTRYSGAPFKEPLFSAMHTQMNRNKRSLVVDLKSEAGKELILERIPQFDVLVENYRPDVLDRLGLGYEVLAEHHPGLIFCSINGFGRDGPYASLPAYDQLMQGLVGLMPAQGGSGPPAPVNGPIADKTSAVTAVGAILAALFARERDPESRGQRVEVAMIDAYAAFALPDPMTPRAFPPDFEETGMSAAFFSAWPTADGHVVGLIIQDHQFAALVERAREEGATFGPVNDIDAFLEDPHVRHRETVRVMEDERFGPTRYLAPPWGFSRTPASIDRHAPRLGEHTDEVLEELGLDATSIAELRDKSAVR